MYKDIISYKLAENITQEHLLKVAREVLENWMSRQPGFKKWEIHRNNDGGYSDIVYWESEGDAMNAQADMVNIPNAADWYSCYEEGSISSMNLNHVVTFK